jgi:hypothetical protein
MSWPKQLTVDKRIVALLSASTYESFPRALRELVSNAHDADATNVDIQIDKATRTISVSDNGTGMTPDEFDFFLRIAGRQRTRTRTTVLGRKRIGQFGIGFLAMFPFSEEVQVESTVAGSPVAFRARIPAKRFLADTGVVEDVTAAEVSGEEFSDESLIQSHYTRFRLISTTRLADRFLTTQLDQRRFRNSIRSWTPMARLRWELQDILPIRFASDSLVATHVSPRPQDFNVTLNGDGLVANDYVEEMLDHSPAEGIAIGKISLRHAIGTPWRAVKPDEARGLRVRLNGVGVGERQHFDLGVAGRTFSRLHWLTGEVNITDGLDEAITLDRDSFTATEDYDQLRDFFRSKLRELAFFVEDVDEAKRKIAAQTTESPRSETAPRAEVVTEQVERLKRRGFTVTQSESRGGDSSTRRSPVEIDTQERVVIIRPDHKTLEDSITVAGQTYRLSFGKWDHKDDRHPACRFHPDGSIEINQGYPLFKAANKDIFRRLQVILSSAERGASSKEELFDIIQAMLLSEFDSR